MTSSPKHIFNVSNLKDKNFLQSHFNKLDSLSIENLNTGGYSGAHFSRIKLGFSTQKEKRLILKELKIQDDWFSHRTNDNEGREAHILVNPKFSHIHSIFSSPYHIVATEQGKIGLLMEDVTEGLFPDERKSIGIEDQNLILNKLAEMHAYYWDSPALSEISWLHRKEDFLYLMGPLDHTIQSGGSARNVQDSIRLGWNEAMKILPDPIKKKILSNPSKIVESWEDLPMTLIHGDSKVANFAKRMDGGLCFLDWAFVGNAPCTFELGWFLAVNSPRLAQPKEIVIETYRSMLESHLGLKLEDPLWARLELAGIVCGAFMLLWSKGLAVANNRNGAKKEFEWWENKLMKWLDQ